MACTRRTLLSVHPVNVNCLLENPTIAEVYNPN